MGDMNEIELVGKKDMEKLEPKKKKRKKNEEKRSGSAESQFDSGPCVSRVQCINDGHEVATNLQFRTTSMNKSGDRLCEKAKNDMKSLLEVAEKTGQQNRMMLFPSHGSTPV